MRKRVKIVLAVVAVALVGVIGWQVVKPSDEPVYKGKPLNFWLKDYARLTYRRSPNTNATASAMIKEQEDYIREQMIGMEKLDEVLRHIGTNAIPTLLRMLRAKDSALKLKLTALAQEQHFIKIDFTPAESWNGAGLCGFQLLGKKAHGAMPALMRITDENISSQSQICSLSALVAIGEGEEAVPTLLRFATNADPEVSSLATAMLRRVFPETAAKAGITNSP